MFFDYIVSEFNLYDFCPEIDNELQGAFIDILIIKNINDF